MYAAEQSIRQSFETAAELAADHHLSAVATVTLQLDYQQRPASRMLLVAV